MESSIRILSLTILFLYLQSWSGLIQAQETAAEIDALAYKIIIPVQDQNYSISVQEGERDSLEQRFRDIKEARTRAGLDGRINLVYYLSYSDTPEQKRQEVARLVTAADNAGLQLDLDIEQLPDMKESITKFYVDAKQSVSNLFARIIPGLKEQKARLNARMAEESVEQFNNRRFNNLTQWQTAANTSTARLFSLVIPPVKIGLAWTMVYMRAGIHPSTLALMVGEALVQGVHGFYGAQANRFKEQWPRKIFGEQRLARFLDAGKFLNLAFFNFAVFSIGYSAITNVLYYNAGAIDAYLTPEFWANTTLIGGLSAVIGTAGARGLYLLQQKSRLSAPLHNYILWGMGLLGQVGGFMVVSGAPSYLTWSVVALGSWLPQALLYVAGKRAKLKRQRMIALSPNITAEQRSVIDKYEDSATITDANNLTPEELAEQLSKLNKDVGRPSRLREAYRAFVERSLNFAQQTCLFIKAVLGY